MKRVIAAALMLCILAGFGVAAYAQEFNTTPGTIGSEGQAILDRRPMLIVFCCIAGVILAVSLVLLVIASVRYHKASKNLRIFCTNLGWVKTMPKIHGCVKASLLMIPVSIIMPVFVYMLTFQALSNSTKSAFEIVFETLLTTGFLSIMLLMTISLVGLLLAIIGLPKSKQKFAGIIACVVHGGFLAFFCLAAL